MSDWENPVVRAQLMQEIYDALRESGVTRLVIYVQERDDYGSYHDLPPMSYAFNADDAGDALECVRAGLQDPDIVLRCDGWTEHWPIAGARHRVVRISDYNKTPLLLIKPGEFGKTGLFHRGHVP